MLRALVNTLKKIPVDLGQYEVRYRTQGKLIAYDLAPNGHGKKALDVGCRDGYWSEKLTQKGYRVISGDLEPQCPGALVLDANRPLPFADYEFDLVWCVEVIEHLTDPAFSIAEFKRVLKQGGTLLLTTPNRDMWLFRLIAALGVPWQKIQNPDHKFFFSYAAMRDLVGRCELYGYFPYMLYKATVTSSAPEPISPSGSMPK